jgi:hypothetical protein
MEFATGISLIAIAISGGTFGRQVYKDRWEKKRHVEVEGRSGIVARPSGEHVEIIGMRVVNRNPRYPIQPNTIAFTPPDVKQPDIWFGGSPPELPKVIEPNSAELIETAIYSVEDIFDLSSSSFVAWIGLKTGDRFHSAPTQFPSSREPSAFVK